MRRVAVALVLGSFALAGCSSGVGTTVAVGDKGHGKQLFMAKCAACHTLAEANASGKVGPNLDASFGPDRAQGFKESTIREVVADQIRFPGNYGSTGPTMPKNLVTGSDLEDVASYVAYVAGMKKNSVEAAAPSGTATNPGSATGAGGGAADANAGKQAFMDNGCNSCHTFKAAGATGTIGPDLDKLKQYAQAAGQDEQAFVKESIVNPDAYVEKGYQKGVMPHTFASLPGGTIANLVAFLVANAKG